MIVNEICCIFIFPNLHLKRQRQWLFADFDKNEKLIGLEILEAKEFIDKKIEFDLSQMESVATG